MNPETETIPFVVELPVLDDEAVDALQEFLWNLVMQFESQYYHQLRRHQQKLDALHRDPLEPWKRITPAPANPDLTLEDVDPDFNDDIPF